MRAWPILLGFTVGAQLIIVGYGFVYLLGPILPLLLAAATAIEPRARGFSLGSMAAALGGWIALILNHSIVSAVASSSPFTPSWI